MNIIKAYINYRIRSKFRHRLHSPFVYSLQDKGMKQKMNRDFKKKLKSFANYLKKNQTLIEITDFGAGSKKLGNIRTISQIYRTASCGKKYGKLLFAVTAHTQPSQILELGTNLGLGTVMMAEANSKAKITTVEGCKQTAEQAEKTFTFFKKQNQIKLVNAQFLDFLKSDNTLYDLIFIDGDHRSASLKSQLNELQKNIHSETLIILDDIRWNKDMFDAWKQIYTQERYHLALDYFRMGIIAKRSHQVKEHFTLRF